MAISDQAADEIDQKVDRAAVTRVLDLRDILELVDDRFDDGAFTKQELVHKRHESVFHV